MSVAFVKEPNDAQVETLPDRELGTDLNLVTARGLGLIETELADLEARLSQMRDADDKIAMATINRDLRYWSARRASAEVVHLEPTVDTVQFGSSVTIERDDGRRQVFQIVGIDEADPTEGLISYLAPVARGLMGKHVGDIVKAGAGDAEIVEIGAAPR